MGSRTNEEKLIEEVREKIQSYKAESFRQGIEFNFFKVEAIMTDELMICRFLRELLDPKGSHGQGSLFLELFINVLRNKQNDALDFYEKQYNNAKVVCEEVIKDDRRIDIAIQIGDRYLPFEVKIYAGDQEKQIEDYHSHAVERDKNAVIYYLTLDGHEPSEDSKGNLHEGQYVCLSFSDDIISWLDACIQSEQMEHKYSLRVSIVQFREVIRELTGKQRRRIEMATEDILKRSLDNILAANQIDKALRNIKTDKLIEIFYSIKKLLSEVQVVPAEAYEEQSNNYYNGTKDKYPEISYSIPFPSDIELDDKLKLTIGVDETNQLYAGIRKEKEVTEPKGRDLAKKFRPIGWHHNKKWYWWIYFDVGFQVRFNECNDNYCRLFDKKEMEEYLKRNLDRIDVCSIFGIERNENGGEMRAYLTSSDEL